VLDVFEVRVERNYFISRKLESVDFLTPLEVELARCVLKETLFIVGGCELIFFSVPRRVQDTPGCNI
jgi:hypothetical protein